MITKYEESILLKHKRKAILGMFRQSVSAVSKMKLNTLKVETSCFFGDDTFRFSLTVFNGRSSDNRTFNLYDFYDFKKLENYLNDVLSVIRTGDFKNVLAFNEDKYFD